MKYEIDLLCRIEKLGYVLQENTLNKEVLWQLNYIPTYNTPEKIREEMYPTRHFKTLQEALRVFNKLVKEQEIRNQNLEKELK